MLFAVVNIFTEFLKLLCSFVYNPSQPIFVMGKRIMDIKGYFFSLLSDEESNKVN